MKAENQATNIKGLNKFGTFRTMRNTNKIQTIQLIQKFKKNVTRRSYYFRILIPKKNYIIIFKNIYLTVNNAELESLQDKW